MLFNCKAQIVTNLHKPQKYGTSGYYYKDLNNDLNNFEGTWLYTNGNDSLTIIFEKQQNKNIQYDNTNYYIDAIIGEYKYVENGLEKINTLENLDNNHYNPYDYNLLADVIYKYGDLSCVDCQPGNITIKGKFSQPDCDIPSTPKIIVRYYVENNMEKLSFLLMSSTYRGNPLGLEPQCQGFAIPYGYYTLIKQ
ncbi:MAG: hypothetical protein ED556_01210 [Winogradskyella sp.]|nr:MAG: hypothetical protein ED556_01210 [Winogradskyella sp.]